MKKIKSISIHVMLGLLLSPAAWAATPTHTPTITMTASPTQTNTPIHSVTPSATRTNTLTFTPTPSFTPTFTVTLTSTDSPTATLTHTPTGTITKSPTTTPTPSATQSATFTHSPTVTLTYTITRTVTITTTTTITPIAVGREEVVTYPSPASGDLMWFYYNVQGSSKVEIQLYNIAGEKGELLTDEHQSSGYVRTPWNISSVAPGLYLYRVSIEDSSGSRTLGPNKLVVIK